MPIINWSSKLEPIVIRRLSIVTFQHMGSRDGVAAKIDADTLIKINEMHKLVDSSTEPLIAELLTLVYDINPELHRNYIKAGN